MHSDRFLFDYSAVLSIRSSIMCVYGGGREEEGDRKTKSSKNVFARYVFDFGGKRLKIVRFSPIVQYNNEMPGGREKTP